MKNIVKRSGLFLLSVVFLVTCNKTEPVFEDEAVNDENQTVLQYIKKLGYHDSEIQDIGDDYLVDGDILFAKDAKPSFTIFDEGPKTKQYGTNNYVGYNVQPNVTVRIDPSLSAYTAEITGALAVWNSVANIRLTFNLTTSTNQHILISHANLGTNVCGAAYFPMNGLPGNRVRLNASIIAGLSAAQRQSLIVHELGHAIGFRHTNWQALGEARSGILPDNLARYHAANLLGTPTGGDPNSIMNGATCGSSPTALSSFDIVAYQVMYPANPPVVGAIPVFRYNHEGNRDHFFTTDITEKGNGANNAYVFEGIGFFVPPASSPGTIPIYRYYHSSVKDHFYTRIPGSYSGYVSEGIAFYAYYPTVTGSVPIYRYNHNGVRDHHYTKNQNEGPMTGYSYEGIEFYAY